MSTGTRVRVSAIAAVVALTLGLGVFPRAQVVLVPSPTTTPIGTGSAQAFVSGTLFTSTTATSTTGTVEETLLSYTLPANTLAVDGRVIRVTAWGRFAANANAKSARVYAGVSNIADSLNYVVAPNNKTWTTTIWLTRKSATLVALFTLDFFSVSNGTPVITPSLSQTLTAPVIIAIKGTSAVAAGDVTADGLFVEAL